MSLDQTIQKKVTILVICNGNLFRSPVAEAFLKQQVSYQNLDDQIRIMSAGLDAKSGYNAPLELVKVMNDNYDVDISGHYSQPLTFDLFLNAKIVLVMEQLHLERLSKQYPRQSHKIHCISELSGKVYDILDPILHPNISLNQLCKELQDLIAPNIFTLLKWLKLTQF